MLILAGLSIFSFLVIAMISYPFVQMVISKPTCITPIYPKEDTPKFINMNDPDIMQMRIDRDRETDREYD